MSNLLQAFIPALGWSLLHFLWQGLLIGCAATLALHLLRNARPQARYLVACVALLLCAAIPLAGMGWRLADAAATGYVLPAPLEAGAIAAIPGTTGSEAASLPLVDADVMTSWEYLLRRQMPWLVLLWAAGALLMTVRLSLGLKWVHARTLPNHYHADPAWQARLSALALRFGITRPVKLGVSADELDGPMTAGILRPIVLVPASLLTGLPPHLLEALLAHELAHVRRHDYLVNLVQSSIEIFLFYHPSVWMLSKRIRIEREQIADDLAASTLGEPRRLALALSELDKFQFSTSHFAAPAAHGGDLMSRIKRLIRPDADPLSWKTAAPPLLGILAACVALYAHAMPQAASEPAAAVAAAPATAAQPAGKAAPMPTPTPTPTPTPASDALAGPSEVEEAEDAADAEELDDAPPVPPAPPAAPTPPAPPALPADAMTIKAARAATAAPAAPAALAAPPAPPAAMAPLPPMKPMRSMERGSHIYMDGNGRTSYAIVREGEKGMFSHGRSSDLADARNPKLGAKGEYVYVRKQGKAYLIQDPALVARLKETWKPAEEQGKKLEAQSKVMEAQSAQVEAMSARIEKEMEAALGSKEQQRAMEAVERDLERHMERAARQQERIARAMERVGRKMENADDRTREQLQRDMEALQKQMEPLAVEMARRASDVGRRHAELAAKHEPMAGLHARMVEVHRPMRELGRKMGELGREQGRLAREADKASRQLIEEAISNGSAKPVM